jgi:hypothetical protein
MGHARRQSLPAVPTSYWISDCQQVLPDHDTVEVAAAGITQTDRRRSSPYESLESKGERHITSLLLIATVLTRRRFTTAIGTI